MREARPQPAGRRRRSTVRPSLLGVVTLLLVAVLMINIVVSGGGSWPDWAYLLILLASVTIALVHIVRWWRAGTPRS